MKRLSDTLTYRGIASEAVFTVSLVVGEFKRTVPDYFRLLVSFHIDKSRKKQLHFTVILLRCRFQKGKGFCCIAP